MTEYNEMITKFGRIPNTYVSYVFNCFVPFVKKDIGQKKEPRFLQLLQTNKHKRLVISKTD